MFLLCHSNYKNITCLAHSYCKKKSLENQRARMQIRLSRILKYRFALEYRYFITNPGRGLFVRPWNLRIVGEHNTHGKRLLTKKWKLFIDPNTGHRYYFNDDKAERATAGYSHAKTNSPSTAKLSSKRVATIVRRASFKARQALRQLSQDDMMKIFNEADPKGTGMLDKEEFAVACRAVNEAITEQEANVVFDYLDINHDDAINFYEFINFAHNPEDPVHRIKKTTDPEGHEHFLNSTMF